MSTERSFAIVQVMYSKYSGIELEDGDDTFVVVREPEILAVLS